MHKREKRGIDPRRRRRLLSIESREMLPHTEEGWKEHYVQRGEARRGDLAPIKAEPKKGPENYFPSASTYESIELSEKVSRARITVHTCTYATH